MTADLAGMLVGALSISGLTVSVGLHGSTYNPHVAELCTLVGCQCNHDLSYVFCHMYSVLCHKQQQNKKNVGVLHLPAVTWFHLKIIVSISTVLLAHER